MTALIHILDAHSANQISAGEVVERPASVVKELVENSLDAGANHIDITVEGNGVPLIRVRDDGNGIGSEDLPLAVIRHATSKITQIEDLDQLRTLGFRGEALPSIASVSKLEISSRPADQPAGLSLTLNAGEQEEMKEIGCPAGTCVTVRDLFFNTPARLKFLKSTPTEFGLISDTVGRIALAHPDIAFSLTHPHQVVLQTSGRGDLREAIAAVLGHAIARQLIPVNVHHEKWHLQGFISPPSLVRSSRQAQYFMINGRIIRSPLLSRALAEGYHTLIPAKLHPIAVLHLSVPPSDYDVNVHPTKMDVRFKEEQELTLFIREAVYNTLIKSKPLPSIQTKADLTPLAKVANTLTKLPGTRSSNSESIPRPDHNPSAEKSEIRVSEAPKTYSQPQIKFPQQPTQVYKHPEPLVSDRQAADSPALQQADRQDSDPFTLKTDETLNLQKSPSDQPEPSGQSLSHIWPLTQLFNTYILATDGKILLMIDQHAAHERINYERLLKEFKQAEKSSQALLIPLPMEFTLQEEQVLLENLWILNEMGFILEQFGSRTYLLRGVPAQTGAFQADDLLRQFIDQVLLKNSPPTFDKILEEWIYMLACKESIKANDSLNLLEMEQLIASLSRTQNPYTCPHGRPTMITMTRSELEKRFYRT
ncbi:DNA mismatch repair endonuclease MutL [Desulfosporosinus youngiae]|uniref:DNA mismatch repair protein MutL n=1 Tax=Desulfosporosinus youngiae DSM 17734 TaxID=768710 RepID=H5Y4A6_9FIRM|nr:DNA mismatch repair endonuclease MutL [Desulfosporosinus youngiae]EHQ89934.1 DNA mismatch repair protein MutL [Desulfosporosinus youngiae DSM 17734]